MMKGYDLAAPGATVDADALALDGCHDRYSMERHVRFSRDNVFYLEGDATRLGGVLSAMAQHLRAPGWVEVAEAILELEAWADWYDSDHGSDRPMTYGDLARRAKSAVGWMAHPQFEYLEAAARLRDGWRPRGWRRKHTKEKTK